MKKTIIVLLFAIAVAPAYQSGWYGISSQNEEKVSVYVPQSDTNSVIVHFFIPGFLFTIGQRVILHTGELMRLVYMGKQIL